MTRTRLLVRSTLFPAMAGLCLFGGAGRFDLPVFWVFLALLMAYLGYMGATMDLSLAEERTRRANRRLRLVGLIALLHWVVAGLDVGRYHWSPPIPLWLQFAALAVIALCWRLSAWSMRVNTFFSSVIRIQKDRGHHVIDSGPYAWVRHPGYAAMAVNALLAGPSLGSLAAGLLTLPLIPALLWRLTAEERTLRAELPGYTDYAGRVRWRLVPGLW